MAVAKKLVILQKLTDHLKGITPDNGYDFNVANSVFRGRTVFGPSDPLPAISILEFPKPDVGDFAGMDSHTFKEDWMLLLQGWVTDDKLNPTDPAYNLGAAVQQRLSMLIRRDRKGDPVYPDLYMLGGGITHIYVGPCAVRPPDSQVSSTAYFFLPLRVGVVTDVSQPYASA